MSLLSALFDTETRSLSYQDIWGKGLDLSGFGSRSKAGEVVNKTTALQLTAVYGSVRILSEGLGQLPRDVFVRGEDESRVKLDRPSWVEQANADLEWNEYVAQLMVSLLLDGNAYAAIQYSTTGEVEQLWPLNPALVDVQKVGGRIVFTVGSETYDSSQILHIKGMCHPGALKGIAPIEACREAIGAALATQTYGAEFFAGDATPGVVLNLPGEVTPVGVQQAKKAWSAHNKRGSVAVLTEGASFQQVSITPEQSQFLATREFNVSEIARIFGIPPHLLADATGSTSWGSGLAEQSTNYVTHSLNPWVRRIEARHNRLLLGGQFLRLNVDGLLRGDYTTRWDTHRKNFAAGLQSADEIRAIEDQKPLPDGQGQTFLRPLNLAPVQDDEGEEILSTLELATVIQRVYLGVGKVMSAKEARKLLTDAGIVLDPEMPEELLPQEETLSVDN